MVGIPASHVSLLIFNSKAQFFSIRVFPIGWAQSLNVVVVVGVYLQDAWMLDQGIFHHFHRDSGLGGGNSNILWNFHPETWGRFPF